MHEYYQTTTPHNSVGLWVGPERVGGGLGSVDEARVAAGGRCASDTRASTTMASATGRGCWGDDAPRLVGMRACHRRASPGGGRLGWFGIGHRPLPGNFSPCEVVERDDYSQVGDTSAPVAALSNSHLIKFRVKPRTASR